MSTLLACLRDYFLVSCLLAACLLAYLPACLFTCLFSYILPECESSCLPVKSFLWSSIINKNGSSKYSNRAGIDRCVLMSDSL